MRYTLQHASCLLNITDELIDECSGKEYRKNLLSIIILENSCNKILVNGTNVNVSAHTILFLSHYQPLVFSDSIHRDATIIQFNAELFCIQKHDAEIGCNGILFNCTFGPPVIYVSGEQLQLFYAIVNEMILEIQQGKTGNIDMLECYLKQFMIQAVRIKKSNPGKTTDTGTTPDYLRIIELQQLINRYYIDERKLGFYADRLHMSESGLHKLIKKFTGRNFTELLSEKLILNAKSQLFTSNDSVKEICYELGFRDPAYFNRFFKKQCGITPEQYRQTVRNCPVTV